MKQCVDCGELKSLDSFHQRADRPGSYRTVCKACKSAKDSAYHAENREDRNKRRDWSKERARKYIYDYLLEHPCVDCGESDIVVLEFDHVRGEKVMSIATMVVKHKALAKIIEEIDKCEVRCANCHRRVTAARGNWSIIEY